MNIPTEVTVTRDTIAASEWVHRPPMIVRRDALNYEDPDSYWRLWWDKFGEVLPDDFVIQLWGEPLSEDERLMIRKTLEGTIPSAYREEQHVY